LNIIDAVKLTSNKYNYSILRYLKKDFWKEFTDKDVSSEDSSSSEESSEESNEEKPLSSSSEESDEN
jgi:hypothetical protein